MIPLVILRLPDAKWTQFNSDGMQQSGNGWSQHAFGTWHLNQSNMMLFIKTKNQLDDCFGDLLIAMVKKEHIFVQFFLNDSVRCMK